jgi:putative NADPH-quinone reductase
MRRAQKKRATKHSASISPSSNFHGCAPRSAPLPPILQPCQEAIGRADHLVMIYPLWLGTMPALMKAFLEQVFRPGFAFKMAKPGKMWTKRHRGKTARIIVTMGMPAPVYRWYLGAHSLKSLERNILGFSGIGPNQGELVRDGRRGRRCQAAELADEDPQPRKPCALIRGCCRRS